MAGLDGQSSSPLSMLSRGHVMALGHLCSSAPVPSPAGATTAVLLPAWRSGARQITVHSFTGAPVPSSALLPNCAVNKTQQPGS